MDWYLINGLNFVKEKLLEVAGLPMLENCMSGYNSCMFAYGQTGSGKTCTMMGDICEMDNELSEDCGMTPRIFEYLFMQIREEEENRRDERLKYSCKCSFLEIYNEQITDLLEPASTNLQLREDMKKGVHVENLKEYKVTTVRDVLKLLLQGAATRKIAATHMNSESSRSHSVFTCVFESRWEKDSMAHIHFGRCIEVEKPRACATQLSYNPTQAWMEDVQYPSFPSGGSPLLNATVQKSGKSTPCGAFGVKCGSPEGGFAASYGDGYGLHSGAADKGPLYGMSSCSWGAFEKYRIGCR
ncbi:kinesin-like protein KIN-12E [Magnolia sinica]|uniref:kinesin-like protein KIN-12E n=1 Tax=Magnolia sinica TaxID=86752 RepID=UPI00265A9BD1|nr:kinesin-like protein KIN-12E [Magnolia sinica]